MERDEALRVALQHEKGQKLVLLGTLLRCNLKDLLQNEEEEVRNCPPFLDVRRIDWDNLRVVVLVDVVEESCGVLTPQGR